MLPRLDKILYEDARADLRAFYETHKTRDIAEADQRLKRLDPFFMGRRLVTITPDIVTSYAQYRLGQHAANGTINRELSTLSKMLRLAYEHGKLQRLPIVKKLREAEPREGFVMDDQFASIRRHLPVNLQAAMSVAYTFGWRKQEVHGWNVGTTTRRLGRYASTPAAQRTVTVAWSGSRRNCATCSMPRSTRCVNWSSNTGE